MEGEKPIGDSYEYFEPEINDSSYPSEINDLDKRNRRKKEKINSIIILSIGFFAIFFGLFSLVFTLANPFDAILKKGAESEKILAQQQQQELLALQTVDTDGDGLSDYLETSQYNTSPYLKDSDSDGLSDKLEIDRGSDPNCATGQSCFDNSVDFQTQLASSFDQTSDLNIDAATDVIPKNQTSVNTPKVAVTAGYVRQIMKQNGATDEQLKDFSDEELLAEFNTYLQSNPEAKTYFESQGVDISAFTQKQGLITPDTSNLNLDSLNIKSAEDLKNLSGAQIRQLMINAGASSAILNSVSDEQLKEMFVSQLESKLN